MNIKGFGYPDFPPTPRGYLPANTDLNVIKADLRLLLETSPGERVMMPEYGCDLENLLFLPNTDSSRDSIRNAIIDAINKWEDRIVVQSVDVSALDTDSSTSPDDDDHVVYVNIQYSPKTDLIQQDQLQLTFVKD